MGVVTQKEGRGNPIGFDEAIEEYQAVITQEAHKAVYKWMEADNPGAMVRTICRRHLYKVGRRADRDALHYAESIEDDPILMGLMGYDTDNYD